MGISKVSEEHAILSDEDLLKKVLKYTSERGITGYDIGKHTSLSEQSGYRILSGRVKNPRRKNLIEILNYIEFCDNIGQPKTPEVKKYEVERRAEATNTIEEDYRAVLLRQYQAEAMAARVKAEVDAMKEILALPPRMQRLRNMARACALLERYHNAGYTTMHMFQNAVAAVYPKIPSIDLACFYDMAVFPDVFICNDVENALNVLKPGL